LSSLSHDLTDCPDVDKGFALWKNYFVRFEDYWNHPFSVQRMSGRKENFSFVHKDVLFVGVNIPGGNPSNYKMGLVWESLLKDSATWTKQLIRDYDTSMGQHTGRVVLFGHANPTSSHATFFHSIRDFIQTELNNRIPILIVNGDEHKWSYNQNYYGQPSFVRIMVNGETREPPTTIHVVATGKKVTKIARAFQFNRDGYGSDDYAGYNYDDDYVK
jgi:hypothetical protein